MQFLYSSEQLTRISQCLFQQQIKVLTRLYHRKLLISYTAFTWNLLCPFLPQTHALFIFLASDINGNLLNVNNKQYTFTSHIFGSDRSSNSNNVCLSGSKWSSFISHAQKYSFKICFKVQFKFCFKLSSKLSFELIFKLSSSKHTSSDKRSRKYFILFNHAVFLVDYFLLRQSTCTDYTCVYCTLFIFTFSKCLWPKKHTTHHVYLQCAKTLSAPSGIKYWCMFIFFQSPDTAAWQNDYLQGETTLRTFNFHLTKILLLIIHFDFVIVNFVKVNSELCYYSWNNVWLWMFFR